METSKFREELKKLIDENLKKNGDETPDAMLAEYLADCLTTYDKTLKKFAEWQDMEIDKWIDIESKRNFVEIGELNY